VDEPASTRITLYFWETIDWICAACDVSPLALKSF